MDMIVGPYTILYELHKSSVSSTYLVYQAEKPERRIVLKLFRHLEEDDDKARAEWLARVDVIRQLSNPYLVPIQDVGTENSQPYLVFPYFASGSLRQLLECLHGERLSIVQALHIIRQVGRALLYAHKSHLLHMHIKPENILFGTNGQAYLADFSLVDEQLLGAGKNAPEFSTLLYMAPERFRREGDERSDQYALGCVAYELIAGMPPFKEQNVSMQAFAHQTTPPPALHELIPDLPAAVEQVIMKALAKDPAQRYADMSAFLQEIASCLQLILNLPAVQAPYVSEAAREHTVTDQLSLEPGDEIPHLSPVSSFSGIVLPPLEAGMLLFSSPDEITYQSEKAKFIDESTLERSIYALQETLSERMRRLPPLETPFITETVPFIPFSLRKNVSTSPLRKSQDLWNLFDRSELSYSALSATRQTPPLLMHNLSSWRQKTGRFWLKWWKTVALSIFCLCVLLILLLLLPLTQARSSLSGFATQGDSPFGVFVPPPDVHLPMVTETPAHTSTQTTTIKKGSATATVGTQDLTPIATGIATAPNTTASTASNPSEGGTSATSSSTPSPIATTVVSSSVTATAVSVATDSFEAESSANTLTGSATIVSCAVCSGAEAVYSPATAYMLQFNITLVQTADYTVTIYYTSPSTTTSLEELLVDNQLRVQLISIPSTGSSSIIGTYAFVAGLSAGSNTIQISGGSTVSPYFDRITVLPDA